MRILKSFTRSQTKKRHSRRRRAAASMIYLALTLGGINPDALRVLEQTVQDESVNPEKYDVKQEEGTDRPHNHLGFNKT